MTLTFSAAPDAEARRILDLIGFRTVGTTATGLVRDERHGLRVVTRLLEAEVDFRGMRVERPTLATLYDHRADLGQ